MSQGNKRYLGDTFINADNRAIQEQFFRSIIDTYQGEHGGDFNALTLWDEATETKMHTYDFATAEQGAKADKALVDPIYLGRYKLINTESVQHVFTDAMVMDILDEDLMDIPWYKDSQTPTTPISMTQALKNIYGGVGDLEDIVDTKLDIATFNTFKTTDYEPFKAFFNDATTTFTDPDDPNHKITLLNAGLINGIRFIVTTQDAYDNNYTEAQKNYWRNFFIIKDASEIPPDYADPLKLQLTDGYDFRVANGYLQVTNGLNDQWKNICSLTELLSGTSFNDNIYAYITNPQNTFVIDKTSLMNSLSAITSSDIDADTQHTYPFLNANLKDDFIHDIKVNNSSTNVTTTTNNGFKNVNINMTDIISAQVNPLITPITNTLNGLTDPANGTIKGITDNITSLSSQITSINTTNTTQNESITSIQQSLTSIQNMLTGINQNIANLSNEIDTWKVYYPQGLVYREDNNVNKTIQARSVNLFNPKLLIGVLRVNFQHYRKSGNANKWVTPQFNSSKTFKEKYNDCVAWAPTAYTTVAVNEFNPATTFVRIIPDDDANDGCNIRVYSGNSNTGFITIRTAFFYRISKSKLNSLPANMPDYSSYTG